MLAIEKEDATDITVASIRRVKKQTLHFAIVLLINYLEDDLTPTTASQTTNEHHLPSALLARCVGESFCSRPWRRGVTIISLPAANASTSMVADVRQADAGGDVVPAGCGARERNTWRPK